MIHSFDEKEKIIMYPPCVCSLKDYCLNVKIGENLSSKTYV